MNLVRYLYCLRSKTSYRQENHAFNMYYLAFNVFCCLSDSANADLAQNMETDENDENSDSTNLTTGDEEATLLRKLEKKKKQLKREEDRLNQMR